ncbi:AraC family transcriptional regulator [Aquabacterium sp. A7-Y]|uniref:AraC family transcriptional regulator n=1 Tax=Aquabacterium sp. A7-Y TaxID=1349605 RepID=UPI00223D9FC2|nr:AraC family transcriptional regulator [Aquabacterium sp. A7-Y]MCW7540978.1 AraC family transcriptional regulator [Aquabacterium sp. A7-Y]
MAPFAPQLKPQTTAVPERSGALISRALAFVDAHLDQPLDANTLADRAAMSRHHFHRMFRAYVGCSVGSYVTWRRLQRACALLASGDEPVIEIALAVGYESAQSLAKALRRELDTTPTAVRRGAAAPWTNLLSPSRLPQQATSSKGNLTMQVTRYASLPQGLVALTATSRGMVDHTMVRAAQQAFGELMSAVGAAGLLPVVSSSVSIVPDDPKGPDDPHCRFVAGAVFGYAMADGRGRCTQPELPLTGSLAWQALSPGRYAVFTHIGAYTGLHRVWEAIYRDWLPASGQQLRDAPPLELCINTPDTAAPEDLHTEVWIPVQA